MEAYNTGQRILARIKFKKWQKWEQMPKDITKVHGHVQTNKVKYMAPFVQLVWWIALNFTRNQQTSRKKKSY
jgi:uncharacterized pyridoxal phosphate-containing UPF0001 family protein